MKKIEANSLEEAYNIACREFGCSIRELKYEIIQYPQKGFLGLFSKKAIIVATPSSKATATNIQKSSNTDKKDAFEPSQNKQKDKESPTEIETKPKENIYAKVETQPKLDSKNELPEEPKEAKNSQILDNFFNLNKDEQEYVEHKIAPIEIDLAREIEDKLKELLEKSCFNIDVVEVDVRDNIAYIFIDGDDAALLIGKEGYRYNALSYLLFNWLNKSYGLYLKLEIAEFISTQESMIKNYIKPVVEHIYSYGWGKTKPLDGILVQIALEQLREEFPNKYVAIKKQKDGSRYIIINEFNKRV